MVFDYHVHTEFSADCVVPIRVSCEAAITAGVTEIAFTDHIDHEPIDPGTGYYRIDDYFRSLEAARSEFAGRLTILAGAEVDFNERIAPSVERFISEFGPRYDFIIGSVHYGEAGDIIFQQYFQNRSLTDVIVPYYKRVKMAAETGWFNTIGHLDLPKRYAPKTHRTYDPLEYGEHLDAIFDTLIAHQVAFEINTSGIRQAPKTSMPGPVVVRRYAERGGRLITTGTDSHAPQTIGFGLAKTMAMLRLCGIEHIASFRAGTASMVPIASLVVGNDHHVG